MIGVSYLSDKLRWTNACWTSRSLISMLTILLELNGGGVYGYLSPHQVHVEPDVSWPNVTEQRSFTSTRVTNNGDGHNRDEFGKVNAVQTHELGIVVWRSDARQSRHSFFV
jgi:hypothetical protein